MTQVVYVDILLTVNLVINYFLLLANAALLKCSVKRYRLVLGAAAGALASLIIFLPPLGMFFENLIKLAVSAAVVLISFKIESLKFFIKAFAGFFLMNFAFAGIMMALWLTFHLNGMVINNSTVYFNINIFALIITAAVCYLVISLIMKLLKRNVETALYSVEITFDGASVKGTAMVDSGNALSDVFSGYPVIIAKASFLKPLLFANEIEELCTSPPSESFSERLGGKTRIIPYNTVGGEGILNAFRPDCVTVKKNGKISAQTEKVFVAVKKEDFGSFGCDVLLSCDFNV